MENEIMSQVLAFSTAIAVIVGAALEMIKRALPKIPKNWIPVIAFGIGLGVGAAAYPFSSMDIELRLWSGAIAGWMSSGIYETVKQVKKM